MAGEVELVVGDEGTACESDEHLGLDVCGLGRVCACGCHNSLSLSLPFPGKIPSFLSVGTCAVSLATGLTMSRLSCFLHGGTQKTPTSFHLQPLPSFLYRPFCFLFILQLCSIQSLTNIIVTTKTNKQSPHSNQA